MAQRGGAVQSHLRYADHPIYSDLIPKGAADMVLSVEPLEVMRYWHFLKPDGWVVTSVTPYVNIPDYPEAAEVLAGLATFPNCILVDAGQIAKAAGNLRAQNMVAVGAASSRLDFTEEELLTHVEGLFSRKGEKIVAVNRRAFSFGRAAGLFFRGLVDGGVAIPDAITLCRAIDAATFDPEKAEAWAAAVTADAGLLATMIEADEAADCSRIPTGE